MSTPGEIVSAGTLENSDSRQYTLYNVAGIEWLALYFICFFTCITIVRARERVRVHEWVREKEVKEAGLCDGAALDCLLLYRMCSLTIECVLLL